MAFSGPTIEQRFPTSVSAPAPTAEMRLDSSEVRIAIVEAAEVVERLVPAGRWKSLALTALEESLMWGNKAVFNERRPDAEPAGPGTSEVRAADDMTIQTVTDVLEVADDALEIAEGAGIIGATDMLPIDVMIGSDPATGVQAVARRLEDGRMSVFLLPDQDEMRELRESIERQRREKHPDRCDRLGCRKSHTGEKTESGHLCCKDHKPEPADAAPLPIDALCGLAFPTTFPQKDTDRCDYGWCFRPHNGEKTALGRVYCAMHAPEVTVEAHANSQVSLSPTSLAHLSDSMTADFHLASSTPKSEVLDEVIPEGYEVAEVSDAKDLVADLVRGIVEDANALHAREDGPYDAIALAEQIVESLIAHGVTIPASPTTSENAPAGGGLAGSLGDGIQVPAGGTVVLNITTPGGIGALSPADAAVRALHRDTASWPSIL